MRIVYNHQIFSLQEYGGISRYFSELAQHLATHEEHDIKILAPLYRNGYLASCSPKIVIGQHLPSIPKTGRLARFISHQAARWWLRRHTPDIVHESYYSPSNTQTEGAKTVVTVHDMIHEKFPEYFSRSDKTPYLKARAVERADHVICVSQTTKNDLVELLDIEPNKVSVSYLGCTFTEAPVTLEESIVQQPYILYVGERRGYKNFGRLLEAYAVSRELQQFRLACFGGGRLRAAEQREVARLGLQADTVLHISGDDGTLANLYRNASAFVYPSLYEGFGIPPLEAMALHCPVVSSDQGSLPEVIGNAAEFFDPYDVDSMVHALESVLFSPQTAAKLVRCGLEQVKKYSWTRCAEETLSVYKSLFT